MLLRPESAPPLPKRLLVSWLTGDGRAHEKDVSVVHAIKSNEDQGVDAMVFEILPGELVNVYMEVYSDTR